MKSTLIMTVLLLLAVTAQAQSIHQVHVSEVTDCYWIYLGRAPDTEGLIFWQHTTDNGSKTLEDLKQAFLVSAEYREKGSTLHQGRDYTAGSDFMASQGSATPGIDRSYREVRRSRSYWRFNHVTA